MHSGAFSVVLRISSWILPWNIRKQLILEVQSSREMFPHVGSPGPRRNQVALSPIHIAWLPCASASCFLTY